MTTKTAATAAITRTVRSVDPSTGSPPPPAPPAEAAPRRRPGQGGCDGRGRVGRPAGRQRSGEARPRTGGRRRLGAEVLEPARLEAGHVRTDARLERLVVGDPVRVRPDELHQRCLAVDPDEVVDRRHALGIGQRELLARRRELAGQPVERDDRVGPDRSRRGRPPGVAVALGQVHREPLVEPTRREVVRVLDRGVEHEVGQLVGHDRVHPAGVDVVRDDVREHRPDVGVSLAPDVLAGPRPERVVERVLVGIDEEVDRLGLGDPEEGRRLLDPLLADLERPTTEGIRALVPVDPNDRTGDRLPVEPGVRVEDRRLGAEGHRAIAGGGPPASGEPGVRDEVAVLLRERRRQGRRLTARGRRDLHRDVAEGAGRRPQQLDPSEVARRRERLLERDPGPVCRARRRGPERRLGGPYADRAGDRRDHECDHADRRSDRPHFVAQARPARRRIPSPLSVAPRSPSRARA